MEYESLLYMSMAMGYEPIPSVCKLSECALYYVYVDKMYCFWK